jgi:hypothetical protein
VLLPDRLDGATTVAAVTVRGVAVPSATVIVPVLTMAPPVYETAVDEEAPTNPVKAVEAPDTTQATVPPRASTTETGPSDPLIEVVPAAAGLSAAVGCTLRVRKPAVIWKVVIVSAAEAGRAIPVRRAAAAAMVRGLRRFMGSFDRCGGPVGVPTAYGIGDAGASAEAVLQAL